MGPTSKHGRTSIALLTACLVLTGGRLWAGESPWYVAARLGESDAQAQFGARHPKWVDDAASSVAVEFGRDVNRYLAVEAGYHDLGSHAGWGSVCRQTDDACIERLVALELCVEGSPCAEVLAALEAEISGFSLALVPRWPIGERLALRGKLGLMAWHADVASEWSGFIAAGAGWGRPERFSGEELLAGLGLHYSFASGLGIVLQHEELDLDVGATSLGLSWRF